MERSGFAYEGVFDDDPDECLRTLRVRLAATPAGVEDWLQPSADRVPVEPAPTDLIDEAIDTALRSIQLLVIDQGAQLDAASLERLAIGLNEVRRAAEAANVAVAERVVATNPFRGDGFLTGKRWLAHRLQLSKREAFHRCQMARMHPRLAKWSEAFIDGTVGIAQTSLMAQIAADPRITDEALQSGEADLLVDAMRLPYEEFKRRALRWQALVDPDGATDTAERLHHNRSATMTEPDSGGWELTARFDDLRGAEFCEVWAHYCAAEFEADWAEARERFGDGNFGPADLRRTDRQRGADALVAMAGAAAACPPNGMRPVPELNVLIDHRSLDALLRGEQVPPSRFDDVVCRTASGHDLDLTQAAGMVLWAAVRRVVVDTDKGHVINWGRKRRLFQGAARKAALLKQMCCIWPGCNVPIRRCEVDHARSWAHDHGGTDQDNADPLCRGHNWLKEHGFRVHRDDHGNWHIHHPDGHEIV
ncbi:MAG: DUF222 domain-containing protein [Ilumatobacteraceae bacterium]